MIEQTLTPPESKYDGNCDEYGRRNGLGIQSWQQEGKVFYCLIVNNSIILITSEVIRFIGTKI